MMNSLELSDEESSLRAYLTFWLMYDFHMEANGEEYRRKVNKIIEKDEWGYEKRGIRIKSERFKNIENLARYSKDMSVFLKDRGIPNLRLKF